MRTIGGAPRRSASFLAEAPAHLTGYSDELAGLLGKTEYINETFAQLVALWEDLALVETAEFARLALSRSGYDPRWADDAAPALRQALEHFGASRVMYLVHISLRSVALTHQRGAVPTSQLGTSKNPPTSYPEPSRHTEPCGSGAND